MIKLFVYGTLKKGFYFHDAYMSTSKFLGPALTGLDVTLWVDGMPHLVLEPSDAPTKGELYEVDMDTLKKLDILEGHPTVYKRDLIKVVDKDGNSVLAWAYLRSKNFSGKSQAFKETEFV